MILIVSTFFSAVTPVQDTVTAPRDIVGPTVTRPALPHTTERNVRRSASVKTEGCVTMSQGNASAGLDSRETCK